MNEISRGTKLLVVDDSRKVRQEVAAMLRPLAISVQSAEDGYASLRKVIDFQPDIILLDIMMPKLDGYRTSALIRHNRVHRAIPIILLSSGDGLYDVAKGDIVGVRDYLTKPFEKEELIQAIKHCLYRECDVNS